MNKPFINIGPVKQDGGIQGNQLEILFNASIDVIYLLEVEPNNRFRFSSVNNAFLAATGLKEEQIIGQYVQDVIPEPSLSLVLEKYNEAITNRTTIQWDEVTVYPAGERTGIVTITPVFNEDGQCTTLFGTVHDITERKKAEKENEQVRYLLNERIKELTTLYKASQLLRDESISTEELLNRLLEMLPPGWQYPEITEVRIVLDGKEFYTPGFQNSVDKQSVEFTIYDSLKGMLEVGYTKKMKEEDEGPFLAEERKLIVMIAEMLGNYFVRKRSTEQLIKEKELSESIINTLPGVFYVFDAEGKYLRWNKNHETITGYSASEMKQQHPFNFIVEEEREMVEQAIAKGFKEGAASAEAKFVLKDGQTIPYLFNGISIEYEGKPAIMGVGFDIAERKKAEDHLRKEKELSESIINTLPGIFYIFDAEGNHLYWNKNYETVTGFSREEISKAKAGDFIAEEDQAFVAEAIGKVFINGYADVEAMMVTKDGRSLDYFFNGISVNYQDKLCLLGIGIDISERKKAEKELRQAEIKFRTLVEKSQVGVYIVQKGEFVYVNPRFAELFGYDQKELIHADAVNKIIAEEYRDIATKNVRARIAGEVETVHYEASGKRKDGSINRVEFYGSRTEYAGLPTIIGTMVDITERKLAEEALQKSEANLHTIFDTTDTIYVLLDHNFQVMSFNPNAAEFTRRELNREAKLYDNLIYYFPKERQPELFQTMKKVLSGEHVKYESGYLQKDGSFNWYDVRMFPITNKEKQAFGMMIAVSDITEKKRLQQEIVDQNVQEQKKITRAILTAQEKERNSIGQELHDNVNQILVGTKMLLGLSTPKEFAGNENYITRSISLIDDAINEIRTITREHVTPQRKIDLKTIVQVLVDNLSLHAAIQTSFVYNTEEHFIKDDLKVNVYRIIQESINNMLKHAEAKNMELSITVVEEELHVSIKDDGKGFDPLTTTSKGIGVSNIINRVESFNGRVSINAYPGKGCHIQVVLPL